MTTNRPLEPHQPVPTAYARWRYSFSLLAVLGAGWMLASCRMGTGHPIKIVSSLPMKGSALYHSQTLVKAIRMAVTEANGEAGPFRIEYVPRDDASLKAGGWDAEEEQRNAQQAVADPDVMVYIGTFNSGAARVAIPITNVANLVMISPAATYPGLTMDGPAVEAGEPDKYYPNHIRNFCRLVPNDEYQAAAEADWAHRLGVHKVFIVHDDGPYGGGLTRLFVAHAQRNNLSIESAGFSAGATDFSSLVARIRQANPDLVYCAGNSQSGAGLLLKSMREAGLEAKFMGPDGIRETAFLDAAGVAAEGALVSLGCMPVERLPPQAKEWYDRYKQQYGEEPESYTLYAYEAARVSLAGIAKAGVKDRALIRDAIMGTQNFNGVLGTWSFDRNGDTSIHEVAGYEVHNHHFEFREMLHSD